MNDQSCDSEFQELVTLFLGELGDRADAIRLADTRQETETLRRLAHQLKGAAGGYGFAELGALAGLVERCCRERAADATQRAAVDKLLAACEAAQATAPQAG